MLQLCSLICALFFSAAAYAETGPFNFRDVDPATTAIKREGNLLKITYTDANGKAQLVIRELEPIEKGQLFFHWTDENTPRRWMQQGGKIPEEELKWLSTPGTGTQLHGPGWYLSSSPVDSYTFGVKAVATETPDAGFWLMKETKILPKNHADALKLEELLSKENVVGSRVTRSWATIFDKRMASKITPMDWKNVSESLLKSNTKVPSNFLNVLLSRLPTEANPYLEKYFPDLNKLIQGEVLSKKAIKDLSEMFFGNFNYPTGNASLEGFDVVEAQRKLFSKINPAQKIDFLTLMVPPSDPDYLGKLAMIDQKFGGLPPASEIAKVYPTVGKLMIGATLSDVEKSALRKQLSVAYNARLLHQGLSVDQNTPLIQNLKREFHSEISNFYKENILDLGKQTTTKSDLILEGRNWGVPLSTLNPQLKDPGMLRSSTPLIPYQNLRIKLDDTARNLLDSYAYIDEPDLIRAIAAGNKEPWALYDTKDTPPLAERWRNALITKKNSEIDSLYQRLTTKMPDYRDLPAIVGGPITPPGSSLDYFRATEEQLNALKQNKYITVHFIPDPVAPNSAQNTFLVRYEYPSAQNYQKYANELPKELVKKLKEAKRTGALKDPTNSVSRALTQEVVKTLSATLENVTEPLDKYTSHISIHPFKNDNNLVARLMYARESNWNPLVLPSWKDVILTNKDELMALRDEGRQRLSRIANDLSRIKTENPTNPNYFDSKELFNGYFHSEVPIGNAQAHNAMIKTFFQDPSNIELINKKQFSELNAKIWSTELTQLATLPKEQQMPILSTWIQSNLRPTPQNTAPFENILQKSLDLSKTNQQEVIRWWLDLSRGKYPDHALSLSKFIENLPAPLRTAYQKKLISSSARTYLKFSPSFSDELKKMAQLTYQSSSSSSDKASAARYLLLDKLLRPTNPNAALDDLVREIPKYLKDPTGNETLSALLKSADTTERWKFIRALLRTPSSQVSESMQSQIMATIPNLPFDRQLSLYSSNLKRSDAGWTNRLWDQLAKDIYSDGQIYQGVLTNASKQAIQAPGIQKLFIEQLSTRSPEQMKSLAVILNLFANRDTSKKMGIFKTLAQKNAWDAIALGLQQAPYFYGEAPAEQQKELNSLLDNLVAKKPEHTSTAYVMKYLLEKNPTAKNNLLASLANSLKNISSLDTDYVYSQLSNILSGKAANDLSILKKVTNSILDMGPDGMAKLEATGIAIFNYDGRIALDTEILKRFTETLKRMPVNAQVKYVNNMFFMSGPFSETAATYMLNQGDRALIEAIAESIKQNNSALNILHWNVIGQVMDSKDKEVSRLFVNALVSGNRLPISNANADALVPFIRVLQKHREGILAKEFTSISFADRLALYKKFEATFAGNDSDWGLKLLTILSNPKDQDQLRTAIGAFPLAYDVTGVNLQQTISSLGDLSTANIPYEKRLSIIQQGLNQLIANKNSAPINIDAVHELMDNLRKFSDKETTLALINYFGIVGGRATDKKIIQQLGERILSHDPEVSATAMKMLARYSTGKTTVKEDILPYLGQFAKRNRSIKWAIPLTPKEALENVLAATRIDYVNDILKPKMAPIVGSNDPCSSSFSKLVP